MNKQEKKVFATINQAKEMKQFFKELFCSHQPVKIAYTYRCSGCGKFFGGDRCFNWLGDLLVEQKEADLKFWGEDA